MAEHPALALIEVLVNLKVRPGLLPESYSLLKILLEPGVSQTIYSADSLSPAWHETPGETRAIGDAWLAKGQSALLAVPSAAAPESFNYLLNPKHPDAARLTIEWNRRVIYDKRLFTTANP